MPQDEGDPLQNISENNTKPKLHNPAPPTYHETEGNHGPFANSLAEQSFWPL